MSSHNIYDGTPRIEAHHGELNTFGPMARVSSSVDGSALYVGKNLTIPLDQPESMVDQHSDLLTVGLVSRSVVRGDTPRTSQRTGQYRGTGVRWYNTMKVLRSARSRNRMIRRYRSF